MTAPQKQTPGGTRAQANNKTSTAIIADQAADIKLWATFRARCALAGIWSWRRAEPGEPCFVCSRSGHVRHFSRLADASAWAGAVAGVRS